jgi:hypothetical protein
MLPKRSYGTPLLIDGVSDGHRDAQRLLKHEFCRIAATMNQAEVDAKRDVPTCAL